jgi:CheY-like chemotaxis protein
MTILRIFTDYLSCDWLLDFANLRCNLVGARYTLSNKMTLENRTARQRSLRLLLVEDHPDLAAATASYLNANGLDVQVAGSGTEALRTAEGFQPDIVLCDMNLPDISGLDVAREFRAQLGNRDVLFAVCSFLSDWEIRSLEREATAADLFLSKPITEQTLQKLLSRYSASPRSSGKPAGSSD